MRERAGGRNPEPPDTAPLDEKLASSDDSMSEAILLTRPKLRRREGDPEKLRDYATATQRAQPVGFAAQRPRSHRPPAGSARAHLPAGLRPRRCGAHQPRLADPSARPTAPPQRQSGRGPSTCEGTGPVGVLSVARKAGCWEAEQTASGPAPWLARPRHVQGSRPREEAARALWGRGEKAERKEVPPGTLSREGGRAASTLAWALRGRVRSPEGPTLSLASRLGSPDLEVEAGPLGLQLGADSAFTAPSGLSGSREMRQRPGLRGAGRRQKPTPWERETLRGELRPRGTCVLAGAGLSVSRPEFEAACRLRAENFIRRRSNVPISAGLRCPRPAPRSQEGHLVALNPGAGTRWPLSWEYITYCAQVTSSCLGDDDVAVEYYGAHTVVFRHISQENINRRDHPALKRILRITESFPRKPTIH